MKHPDSIADKTPLFYIEELTQSVPFRPDNQNASILVKRQQLTRELASGAVRIVTVDLMDIAEEDVTTPLGRVDVRIDAKRAFMAHGGGHTSQYTELSMAFTRANTMSLGADASVPFDAQMESETRNEWLRWGMRLDYEDTETKGHFLVSPLEDQTLIITQTLADIAQTTRLHRYITSLPLVRSLHSRNDYPIFPLV